MLNTISAIHVYLQFELLIILLEILPLNYFTTINIYFKNNISHFCYTDTNLITLILIFSIRQIEFNLLIYC